MDTEIKKTEEDSQIIGLPDVFSSPKRSRDFHKFMRVRHEQAYILACMRGDEYAENKYKVELELCVTESSRMSKL